MSEKLQELKACQFKPSFQVGDIVEIGGAYAGDWRGTLHHIGQVYWNKKLDRIEYGTYQVDTKDALTDGWTEEDLIPHTRAPQPPVDAEVVSKATSALKHAVTYLKDCGHDKRPKEDIAVNFTEPEHAMFLSLSEALAALEGLRGEK